MTEITPAQLDELEALERAATAGPWDGIVSAGRVRYLGRDIGTETLLRGDYVATTHCGPNDAPFIAALRNAAPSLFAALRAAWARIEELERANCRELQEAVKAEREACAKVAEEHAESFTKTRHDVGVYYESYERRTVANDACLDIVDAIRARNEVKP